MSEHVAPAPPLRTPAPARTLGKLAGEALDIGDRRVVLVEAAEVPDHRVTMCAASACGDEVTSCFGTFTPSPCVTERFVVEADEPRRARRGLEQREAVGVLGERVGREAQRLGTTSPARGSRWRPPPRGRGTRRSDPAPRRVLARAPRCRRSPTRAARRAQPRAGAGVRDRAAGPRPRRARGRGGTTNSSGRSSVMRPRSTSPRR